MANAGPYLTPRRVQVQSNSAATNTDVVLTLDAAPTPGNVVLISFSTQHSVTHTHTDPTGFTAIATQLDTGTTNRISLYYRVVLPGDAAAVTCVASVTADDLHGQIEEVENLDLDNVVDISGTVDVASAELASIDTAANTAQDTYYVFAGINVASTSTGITFGDGSDADGHALTLVAETDAGGFISAAGSAAVNYATSNPETTAAWTTANISVGAIAILNAARAYGFEEPKLVNSKVQGIANTAGGTQAMTLGFTPTAGNTLVAIYNQRDAGQTMTEDADFTEVSQADGILDHVQFSYRTVASGDTGPYTFTSTGDNDSVLWIGEYSGIDTGDPLFGFDFDAVSTAETTPVLSSATDQDVCLVVATVSGFQADMAAITSDWLTERENLVTNQNESFIGDGVVRSKAAHSARMSWTGNSFALGGMVAFRAKRQPYKTPVVVQTDTNYDASASSHTVATTNAPKVGNVLLAIVKATGTLTADADITEIAAHTGQIATSASRSSVGYRIVQSGDTGSFTYTGTSLKFHSVLYELANVDIANLLSAADFIEGLGGANTDATTTMTADEACARTAGIGIAYVLSETTDTGGSEAFTNNYSAATIPSDDEMFTGYKVFSNGSVAGLSTVASWTTSVANQSGLLVFNAAPMTGFCTPYRVQTKTLWEGGAEVTLTFTDQDVTPGNLIVSQWAAQATAVSAAPTGFTMLQTLPNNRAVAYRIVQEGDTNSHSWQNNLSGANWISATEYSGIDPNAPFMSQIDVSAHNGSSDTLNTQTETDFTDTMTALLVGWMGTPFISGGSYTVSDGFEIVSSLASSVGAIYADRVVTSSLVPSITFGWLNSIAVGGGLLAFRAAPSPIVRWQEASNAGTDDTPTVTLPQTPEPSQDAYVVVTAKKATALTMSVAPSGWTEVTDATNADFIDSGTIVGLFYVYYRSIVAGDSATVSMTLSATADWAIQAVSYAKTDGLPAATSTDAEAAAASATLDAFSVITPEPSGLLLLAAAFGVQSADNFTSADNGFLAVNVVDDDAASAPILSLHERIVCATGTYAPNLIWDGNEYGAGALLGFGADLPQGGAAMKAMYLYLIDELDEFN